MAGGRGISGRGLRTFASDFWELVVTANSGDEELVELVELVDGN